MQVRLDLLRRPCLKAAGSEVPLSRKDAALLAVIALDGSAMRDTLAIMLWPQADPSRARASLRQRRFRLARNAGGALLVGDERLTLAKHVLHSARDLDATLSVDPQACDGEWLEGLSYADCPEMEQWLQLARERWRVLRSQSLARVASAHENAGRVSPALQLALRLAAQEPLSDHAHRRLMRLHHLRGDLGAALDVYRRFAERLDAELGELPDDETAALAASLRRGEAATRPAAPLPPTLARPARRIGRDAAWAALQSATRQRSPVVVEGAPGVGKSRLLGDFVAAADSARILVPAFAGDANRPYALLTRLLAQLWFDGEALRTGAVDALPGWARYELAALLPELGSGAPRADAMRLQRAFALALKQANLECVALDDVQQADRASLELLPALAGAGLPCWALAVRAGEAPEVLQQWLQGSNAPHVLSLGPLDPPQLADLLEDLALPGVAGDEWVRALMRHTGGVPLFLLETLRGLYQTGRPALDALPSSTGAAAVVRTRAARLPDAARQVAHMAAVLRSPLTIADSAALLGGQAVDWRSAFAALEAAQWLDEEGRMHDLVSAALRDAMSAAERRWLHARIAAWMVESNAPPLAAAQHYEEAGRDVDAAPLFEAAALAARRASRPAEDAALWERAAAAWERCGRRERAFNALRESLAPRSFAGGTSVTLPVTERLMTMARTPAERMVALGERAHALAHDGDHVRAAPLAREAYTIAQTLDDERERLKIGGVLAQQLSYTEASGEALTLLAELRPVADRLGGEPLQLFLNALTQALHRASRLAECAEALEQSLALLVADENWREATTVGGNLSLVLANLGRYREAWQVLQRANNWRQHLGEPEGTMLAGYELKIGHVMLGLGRLGSALTAYQRARAQYAANGSSDSWLVSCDHALASCHLLLGDEAAARSCLRPFTTPQPAFMRARRSLLQAQVAAAAGEDVAPLLAAGRAAADGARDAAAQAMVAAEAAWLEGDARDPARLLRVEEMARRCEQQAIAVRVAWWRVAALCASGDTSAAAGLARELLAGPSWPSLLLPAHWLRIAQRAFAASGDEVQAQSLRERADAAWNLTRDDVAAHGILARPPVEPPDPPGTANGGKGR